MNKTQIQEKIDALKIEQATLSSNHDQMVAAFQQQQQAFQKQVQENQNRFQQIAGAIAGFSTLLAELAQLEAEMNKPTQPPPST